MSREGYKIVDANGSRITIATYFTPDQAFTDIKAWLVRQERGGRPDISRELLESLHVVREDGIYD